MIKKYCIFCLKVIFTFTNSVEPDEMQHYAAIIWVFTVYKSTRLGVSRIQIVNKILPTCFSYSRC